MAVPPLLLKLAGTVAYDGTTDQAIAAKGVGVDELVVPTVADFAAERDRALDVARGAPLAVARPELDALLSGRWTGTLDYRDFKTDRRTVLPTDAKATAETDGVAFAFDYDDGPGKRVTATQRWRIEGNELRVESNDGTERFRIAEHRSTGPSELTLVFHGEAKENRVPVLVRTIDARRRDTLSITRMTRIDGSPFLMRHAYWLKLAH